MTANSKETKMTNMFEAMSQNIHTAMDAGRQMQDNWFTNFANFGMHSNAQPNVITEPARKAKNWMTMLHDNVQSFGEATQCCFQSNLDVFKVATTTPVPMCEGDVYTSQRKVLDSGFQALQKNMDTMNKAGQAATDRWTTLTKSNACCGTDSPKSGAKESKPSRA